MNDPVIVVEHAAKRYRLRRTGSTFKSAVMDFLRGNRGNVLAALDDVSFSAGRGETLGIIGSNGAGKSTLLSLLAGTTTPTSGSVKVNGTVSSLLELGAGFHPDLTGRENVFLYGAIMGITRRQMKERFDSIVEFSGLAQFIDQPVRHYSSGMYVRLGFAVAVEVDPDILLIDEVLAVGDVAFQQKCLQKIDAFRKAGKTLLIVSHDLPTIRSISNRILLLDKGRIVGIGDPDGMVQKYASVSRQTVSEGMRREWGTGDARITAIEFTDEAGVKRDRFQWGGTMCVRIMYDAKVRIENPVFGFGFANQQGVTVFGNNTQIDRVSIGAISGKGNVSVTVKQLPLAPGAYLASFSIHSTDHLTNYHRLDHAFSFAIEGGRPVDGVCCIPCEWKVGEEG